VPKTETDSELEELHNRVYSQVRAVVLCGAVDESQISGKWYDDEAAMGQSTSTVGVGFRPLEYESVLILLSHFKPGRPEILIMTLHKICHELESIRPRSRW